MDILVDVKYAKLDTPEVQDNIPDDLRWSECSKSESKATNKVTKSKEGVYYKKIDVLFCVCLCICEPLSPTIVPKWGFKGGYNFKTF